MTERDRKIVEDAKAHGGTMGTKGRDLLELIDRLDKQLAKIKEAMRPVRFVVAHTDPNVDDDLIVYTVKLPGGTQYAYLELRQLRRLVETLEEVKHADQDTMDG